MVYTKFAFLLLIGTSTFLLLNQDVVTMEGTLPELKDSFGRKDGVSARKQPLSIPSSLSVSTLAATSENIPSALQRNPRAADALDDDGPEPVG